MHSKAKKGGRSIRTLPRRDKLKIYADLLYALYSDAPEKIVLTQVQVKINVPFDRLKVYIAELSELGLLKDQTSLELTEKGKEYLKEYERVLEFIKRMGLSYR